MSVRGAPVSSRSRMSAPESNSLTLGNCQGIGSAEPCNGAAERVGTEGEPRYRVILSTYEPAKPAGQLCAQFRVQCRERRRREEVSRFERRCAARGGVTKPAQLCERRPGHGRGKDSSVPPFQGAGGLVFIAGPNSRFRTSSAFRIFGRRWRRWGYTAQIGSSCGRQSSNTILSMPCWR